MIAEARPRAIGRSHRPAARLQRAPRALVLRAPGTNCDRETALALELAGARPERVHVEVALAGGADLDRFALLVLPGGFSFGDHLGAGALWAHRLEALREGLRRFVDSGRPVLGICNGFQALLKLGLLQGGTLAANASGRFECRWVWLERPANAATPLLAGIDRIALPVAHGEGRFVAASTGALRDLRARGNVALTYAAGGADSSRGRRTEAAGDVAEGEAAAAGVAATAGAANDLRGGVDADAVSGTALGRVGTVIDGATIDGATASDPPPHVLGGDGGAPIGYPANPNGSAGAVAALANAAGNVLGLMPHPERCVLDGQAPSGRADGAGLAIFRNAVAMARG